MAGVIPNAKKASDPFFTLYLCREKGVRSLFLNLGGVTATHRKDFPMAKIHGFACNSITAPPSLGQIDDEKKNIA
jgi:hypothetical protein